MMFDHANLCSTGLNLDTIVGIIFRGSLTIVAFLSGGVAVSLGRQIRNFVRPHFLPPADTAPSAPNSLPKWPYPNLRKRVYDLMGWAVVQCHINYIVIAFMLLDFDKCIIAWKRNYFYGHVTMIATMLFFHFGGRRALRKGLPEKKASGSVKHAPRTEAVQPVEEKNDSNLEWVRHDLDNKTNQPGTGADNRFVDDIVRNMETPFESRRASPEL
jgi:lysophospholipid acyltransferase